jgi:hypothetical protein
VRDHRGEGGVGPQVGRGSGEMREEDGRDSHQGAVPCRMGAGLLPFHLVVLEVPQEVGHGVADAEDALRAQAGGPGSPEGELGVVAGEADGSAIGVGVGDVVGDLSVAASSLAGEQAFGGVAEGVAYGQAEEHGFDAVEVEGWGQGLGGGVEEGCGFEGYCARG